MQYLLARGHVSAAQFPQGDKTLSMPPQDDPDWVADMHLLVNIAPGMSEEVLTVRASRALFLCGAAMLPHA